MQWWRAKNNWDINKIRLFEKLFHCIIVSDGCLWAQSILFCMVDEHVSDGLVLTSLSGIWRQQFS